MAAAIPDPPTRPHPSSVERRSRGKWLQTARAPQEPKSQEPKRSTPRRDGLTVDKVFHDITDPQAAMATTQCRSAAIHHDSYTNCGPRAASTQTREGRMGGGSGGTSPKTVTQG